MKFRFLIIFVLLCVAQLSWGDDIPGKKCKYRDDCDNVKYQDCILGHCLWDGTNLDKIGCCYKNHNLAAQFTGLDEDDTEWVMYDIDCGKWGEQCGWDVKDGGYVCVKAIDNQTTFYEDPSGKHPRECDFTCHPRCEGKECGPDWCGGSCGECPAGQVCTKDGKCCTPQCEGKECGPDGCGGTCGKCKKEQQCVVGKCVWPGVDIEELPGCCYGQYLISRDYTPEEGRFLVVFDCKKKGLVCAWDDEWKMYDCEDSIDNKKTFLEDPTGKHPRECDFTCHPWCDIRDCGPDGCGGSCGTCKEGDVCTEDGICCTPHCEGRECGEDGCGGSCGECEQPVEYCSIYGKCVNDYGCSPHWYNGCPTCACEECVCNKRPECCTGVWNFECVDLCKNECGGCRKCVPDCKGKECGSDGCRGVCGYCHKGEVCVEGKCVKHCGCKDRECGYNECGDFCGKCPTGQVCTKDGKCCTPHCEGKECGNDGCGGSCGTCPYNHVCRDGKCVKCGSKPMCKPDWDCGDDGCGHECGFCGANGSCVGHTCYSSLCVPFCGKEDECGDDGCGGSCGKCGPCEECISRKCRVIPGCNSSDDIDITESGENEKDAFSGEKDSIKVKKDMDAKDRVNTSGEFHPKSGSGGGCAMGKGSGSGILLILMGVLGLILLRRQKRMLNRD